jgi:death on curing protein
MDFLELEEVLRAHRRGLERHGGLHGIREPGLVDSALASAQNVHFYAGGDAFDVAAAYAFHLAESQAFVDGNKRVGITCAIMFLARNGWAVLPSAADELYEAMIALATHDLDKPGLSRLLRRVSVRVK